MPFFYAIRRVKEGYVAVSVNNMGRTDIRKTRFGEAGEITPLRATKGAIRRSLGTLYNPGDYEEWRGPELDNDEEVWW